MTPPPRRRPGRRGAAERARASARSALASAARSDAGKQLLALSRRAAGSDAGKAVRGGLAALASALGVLAGMLAGGLRELGRLWVRSAEALGSAILIGATVLYPLLVRAARACQRAIGVAQRAVTPQLAVAAVTAAAAALMAASQFVDYRGVEIGAPAYEGVQAVAPAPQTDRETTGSAHGYLLIPVALLAAAALALALRGRWRLGRIVSAAGATGIVVSLLVDMPKGLQEGQAGIAYEGARAVLVEGFWLQLSSSAVLAVLGLLVARYARAARGAEARRMRRRRPAGGGRRGRTRVAGVRA